MHKAQIGHLNVYQIDSHLIISPSGKMEMSLRTPCVWAISNRGSI